MALKLQEWEDMWEEGKLDSITSAPGLESFEYISELSPILGRGLIKEIDIHPEICLSVFDYELWEDVVYRLPGCEHPLEFGVWLSGKIVDGYGRRVGDKYTVISGGGLQDEMSVKLTKSRYFGVDIHLHPNLLQTFFPGDDGETRPQFAFLNKGNDQQIVICPKITTSVEQVTRQILSCPYWGITKQMYLQGKVIELMALQLAPILSDQREQTKSPQLKSTTVARLHHAREILHFRLENPPSLVELAEIVGISDRTLRYGFKILFGTTVFSYLTEKRLERAEQLLRNGEGTVAEVANLLGYSHLGHFAGAFKRKFGITPSECLLGKKSISAS